jgi:hypothetical protein
MHTVVWWGNLGERVHLEDLGVGGRLILKCIFKKWDGVVDVDWNDLAQDRNGWQGLLDVAINPRVPNNAGNFLTI